jgi:hypothetical protein
MGAPVLAQEDFRFRNNDGNLAGATYMGTGNNEDQTISVDTTFRLRVVVQETAGGNAANTTMALYVSYNSGAYAEVNTTSSYVQLVDENQGIADHATTAQDIGDGTYTGGDSEGYNDGTTDDDTGNVDLDTNEAEVEFALTIVSGDVSNADTLEFEVRESDGSQFGTYPENKPTVTVSKETTFTPRPHVTFARMIGFV